MSNEQTLKDARQFLADVHTAAGMLAHGKQSKKLAERLGNGCMKFYPMLNTIATPPQPVAAEGVTDGWPKLDSPASIGGGSFGKGVSSRLLVEAAQRKYEFEAEDSARTQEQRVKEEMNRRAMWDFVHGPIPAISTQESGK